MTPHRIAALDEFVAVRIAAGDEASFAVTDNSSLFSWGRRHITGHGDIKEHVLEPRQVTALTDTVVDVAASHSHVMVVGTGHLWSFGNNARGQLGTGDVKNRRSPHLVVSPPPGERVVQAAAGDSHSLALMESGAVYSWGYGACGQLGHGDEENQLLPRRIEVLAGNKVVRVDANGWGSGISAVTTSEGAVLMFGMGDDRALGLEDEEDSTLPTRVEALPKGMAVADMALGGDPDDGLSWSVVMMGGGGIVSGSLYRWGVLQALDGVGIDPMPEEEEVPPEGSSVVAWQS